MLTFSDLISISLYLGLIGLLGYTILCALLTNCTRSWAEILGLSFSAGAGGLSLILFYVSIAGLLPSRMVLIVIAIIAIFVLSLLRYRQAIIRPAPLEQRRTFDAITVLGLLSCAAILAAVLNASSRAAWPILTDVDALAIWMFKAKWVALQPLRPIPAVFMDPVLSYSHQDYPLALPFLTAGLYAALNRIDDTVMKVVLIPIYLSLLSIVYSAARRLHRRSTALMITAVFGAAPTLAINAGFPVAETPLLLAYASAVTLLLRWMETNQAGDLRSAALFAAIAAFTKNEGLALLPILGACSLVWVVVYRDRRQLRDWFIAAALAVFVAGPWLIFRIFLPKTHEDYGGKLTQPTALFHNLYRAGYVVPEYFGQLFNGSEGGVIWYVLIIAAVLGWRGFRRRSAQVLWGLLAIQLCLYLVTFMVTPWDVHVLLPMITPKLLVQASPVAAMLITLHLCSTDWPGAIRPIIGRDISDFPAAA